MVTNEDVLRFYADKGEDDCELTKKYKKNHLPDGPYADIANDFISMSNGSMERDGFYRWLENQDLSKTLSLRELDKEDKAFVLKPNPKSVLIEKWHLYVSFYALEEYWAIDKNPNRRWLTSQSIGASAIDKNTGIFNCTLNKCHALWLWLYECSNPIKESEAYLKVKNCVDNDESLRPLLTEIRDETIKNIKIQMPACIVHSSVLSPACSNQYYLKLDRTAHCLNVYEQDSGDLREFYPLREDFDASDYVLFTLKKSVPCIFGGEGKARTPEGIFRIEYTSEPHEEYISSYHPQHEKVKFFGYLKVFEDYFIHSDMYLTDAEKGTFADKEPISLQDGSTSGCIRVSQEELDWLVENIPVGSTIET